jgi:hypothetical protein
MKNLLVILITLFSLVGCSTNEEVTMAKVDAVAMTRHAGVGDTRAITAMTNQNLAVLRHKLVQGDMATSEYKEGASALLALERAAIIAEAEVQESRNVNRRLTETLLEKTHRQKAREGILSAGIQRMVDKMTIKERAVFLDRLANK